MVNAAVTVFLRCGGNDTDIIDQPRPADRRGGDQPHLATGFRERFQGPGIDQRKIVDLEETGVDQGLLGAGKDAPDRLAGGNAVSRVLQGIRQGERPSPVNLVGIVVVLVGISLVVWGRE